MSNPFDIEAFSDWESDKETTKEVVRIMDSIHILVEGCTANLIATQLEVVQGRMKDVIKQCCFWREQDNRKRFIYDLREFGLWLADFITEAENNFWNEENLGNTEENT